MASHGVDLFPITQGAGFCPLNRQVFVRMRYSIAQIAIFRRYLPFTHDFRPIHQIDSHLFTSPANCPIDAGQAQFHGASAKCLRDNPRWWSFRQGRIEEKIGRIQFSRDIERKTDTTTLNRKKLSLMLQRAKDTG